MEHKKRPSYGRRNMDDQLTEVKKEFKQIWNALPDRTKKIIRNSGNSSKPKNKPSE